jgi:hypothetical protein
MSTHFNGDLFLNFIISHYTEVAILLQLFDLTYLYDFSSDWFLKGISYPVLV